MIQQYQNHINHCSYKTCSYTTLFPCISWAKVQGFYSGNSEVLRSESFNLLNTNWQVFHEVVDNATQQPRMLLQVACIMILFRAHGMDYYPWRCRLQIAKNALANCFHYDQIQTLITPITLVELQDESYEVWASLKGAHANILTFSSLKGQGAGPQNLLKAKP
jgi:hypothetical protein